MKYKWHIYQMFCLYQGAREIFNNRIHKIVFFRGLFSIIINNDVSPFVILLERKSQGGLLHFVSTSNQKIITVGKEPPSPEIELTSTKIWFNFYSCGQGHK